MMQCDLKPTDEIHESGRKILRCSRASCRQIQLEPLPGARMIPRDCDGWANWFLFGYWLDAWLRVFGITKARVKRVIPCNCEADEKSLNEAGGALAAKLGTALNLTD